MNGGGAAPRSPVVQLAKLDELNVRVEKLVAGGDGLARHAGIPILVPLSAPGDRLRVRLIERHSDYGRAEIVEILEAGPGRRSPPCPYYSRCGGCSLQHITDERQIELKVEAANETLRRLGGLSTEDLDVEVHSAAAWGYRLRTQLHRSPAEGEPRMGYHARASHEIVEVSHCPILVPSLQNFLATLSTEPPTTLPKRLDVASGGGGELTTAPIVDGLPHGEVEVTVGPHRLRYDARCFFQAHAELLEPLCVAAVGSETGEVAYDLYAGVGLFSLPLCRSYERVVAVEGNRIASRFAKKNLQRNRLRNAEVKTKAVESWIQELPERVDRVLVDPPRSGLARPVCRRLLERKPRHLTYVSCHSATLARDLKTLMTHFEILSLSHLDLFPQTGHLESVVQLRAREL